MQFDSHKKISESEGPHANNESGTGKLKCSSAFCTPNYHVKWISHYIQDARIHLGAKLILHIQDGICIYI